MTSWRLAPATRWLLAWVVAHLVLLNLCAPAGGRLVDPALSQVGRALVEVRQGYDSWGTMIPAYRHVQLEGAASLYGAVVFDREIRYLYPPTALLVFLPLEALGVGPADWELAFWGISAAMYGVLMIAMVALARACMERFAGLDLLASPADRWGITVVAAIACATFFPLTQGLGMGQVQLWMTTFLTLALYSWLRGERAWSGAWLGLVALLKPHFALLLLWGLVRRQWGLLAAFLGVAAAALAASVWWLGPEAHLQYLDVVRFLARHGESHWHNQSLNGLLHRALADPGPLLPHGKVFPAYHGGIHLASTVYGAAIVIAALLLPARRGGSLFDLGLMLLAITLASPIAWFYHYAVLLPLFIMLAAVAAGGRRVPLAFAIALAGFYLATGSFWLVRAAWAGSALGWLFSICFLGALGVWGLLAWVARRGEEALADG